VFYWDSKTRLTDIKDGTSLTLAVGERPPSTDLQYGWWFAGAGWDGNGVGDVLMTARATDYTASLGCPATSVGFQAGNVTQTCDQAHYWSQHSNGANFLMCDGSARFLTYGANDVLIQMMTKNKGEVYTLP
jgi:prepilin-type processing-associated H-X9-DG protein